MVMKKPSENEDGEAIMSLSTTLEVWYFDGKKEFSDTVQ